MLLAGPTGTPYANGVWRLHLDIPPNYPTAPPTATFRTRLWHPNIDEATGAVCVETLKRDWSSTLKLRDVLVTISCLLIQPNPASALNETAGKLASEDWDSFCRRARLMTDIHAGIPEDLLTAVKEAQMRGEEPMEKDAREEVKSEVSGKGKEKVGLSPSAGPKIQQSFISEEEENAIRRGVSEAVESEDEGDWIPGPRRPLNAAKNNIFGIKYGEAMEVDAPTRKDASADEETENRPNLVTGNSFTTVLSERSFSRPVLSTAASSSLVPPAVESIPTTPMETTKTKSYMDQDLPERVQHLAFVQEFSWSWAEAMIMHGTGAIPDGSKDEVKKRLASDEFEKKREFELKKLKQCNYDIKKYNKGQFGPRVGIYRL